MHRIVPSQVPRFIARTAATLLLTAHFPVQAQQKPAPSSPNSQAQLEARVKDLEARLTAAEQKAASAAMEKDYITRVQKQYETYYDKVLSTQTWTLGIFGLILTAVFFLAGRIGFGVFDRRIDSSLREVSAQLRTEFTQQLRTELDALRAANAERIKELEAALTKRISDQEEDLKTRSDYQFHYVRGLAAYVDERYAESKRLLRQALAIYKSGRDRRLFDTRTGARTIANLFSMLKQEDEANHVENARNELADKLYNGLEEELALAALNLTWLAPLLEERK